MKDSRITKKTRIFSILLVLCLTAGLFSVNVSAAGTVLDHIHILSVDYPMAGDPVPSGYVSHGGGMTHSPSGAIASLSSLRFRWLNADGSAITTSTFVAGVRYKCQYSITPASGYRAEQGTTDILVDYAPADEVQIPGYTNVFKASIYYTVPAADQVARITVLPYDLPRDRQPVPTASDEPFNGSVYSFPEGSVTEEGVGIRWLSFNGSEITTPTFEAGVTYKGQLAITPTEGYQVGRAWTNVASVNRARPNTVLVLTPTLMVVYFYYTVPEPEIITDPLDVSGIVPPETGEHPDFEGILPEDSPYHFATAEELTANGFANADKCENGIWWRDADGNYLTSADAFESRKRYSFEAALIPDYGYAFGEDASFTIDGSYTYVDGQESCGDGLLLTSYAFHSGEVLTNLRLNRIHYPVAGDPVPDAAGEPYDGSLIYSPPTGLVNPFSSIRIRWLAEDGSPISTPTFEDGVTYRCQVTAAPNLGLRAEYGTTVIWIGEDRAEGLLIQSAAGVFTAFVTYTVRADDRVTKVSAIVPDCPRDGKPVPTAYDEEAYAYISSFPEGAVSEDSRIKWFQANGAAITTPRFEAGVTYLGRLTMRTEAGYEVGQAWTDIRVDREPVARKLFWSSSEFAAFFEYTVPEPWVITDAYDVSGIALPRVGGHPDFEGILPGEDYHFASAEEMTANGFANADQSETGIWWRDEDGNYLTSEDTFEEGKEYYFEAALIPEYGYTFDEGTAFTINGSAAHVTARENRGRGILLTSERFTADVVLTALSIHEINYPTAGDPAPTAYDEPYGGSLSWSPATASYGIFENIRVSWLAEDGSPISTPTFEAGVTYKCQYTITPKAGIRAEAGTTVVQIGRDGKPADEMLIQTDTNVFKASVKYTVQPANRVTQVSVFGGEYPQARQPVPTAYDEPFEPSIITFPAEAVIPSARIKWFRTTGGEIETPTFEAGVTYLGRISMSTEAGYEVGEAWTEITVDMEPAVRRVFWDESEFAAFFEYTIPEPEPITDPTDVSAVEQPRAGENPDFLGVLPEDSPYHFASEEELTANGFANADKSIAGIWWRDAEGNFLTADDTFERGKEYYFEAALIPDYGFEFEAGTVFTIDESDEFVGSQESRGLGILLTSVRFKATEKIASVDVSGISYPKAGDPVSSVYEPFEGLITSDPTDAIASARIKWFREDEGEILTSSFEPGVRYLCRILLTPDPDWIFTGEMDHKVEGLPADKARFYTDGTLELFRYFTVPTDPKITSVEVSDITLPSAAEQPDYEGLLPAGAPYHFATLSELRQTESLITLRGIKNGIRWWSAAGDRLTAESLFALGEEYYFEVWLAPDPGYEFDSNVLCTINGSTELCATSESKLVNLKITSAGRTAWGTDTVSVSGSFTSFGDTAGETVIRLIPQDASGTPYDTRVTGNTGDYSIPNVLPGVYDVRVEKADHVTREYTITVGAEDVTQDVTIWLLGDVNGDGKCNNRDRSLMQKHLNETEFLTGYAFLCGDVTGDGKINNRDRGRIQKHLNETDPLW